MNEKRLTDSEIDALSTGLSRDAEVLLAASEILDKRAMPMLGKSAIDARNELRRFVLYLRGRAVELERQRDLPAPRNRIEKKYAMDRGSETLVWVILADGSRRPLVHHKQRSEHFDWGFTGNGPLDLSESLVWDLLGEEPTWSQILIVQSKLVASIPYNAGGVITETQIRSALALAR